MILRPFSFHAFRLAVLALLGVIALQAIPAGPLPAHVENGSAFSASTAEVSLSSREESAERQIALPALDRVPAVALVVHRVAGDMRPAHLWAGLRQRGPPPRWPQSPGDSPRGPPVLI